ncbi:MAG: transcriptional regulator NrdR [Candidatus Edwardsbacteria bacterium]
MKCPTCGFPKNKVIDSRLTKDAEAIRRRRQCLSCGKRYTTYEYIESPLMVVKKDGRREAFDREKIIKGMRKACEKRPISIETLEKTVDGIENEMQNLGKTEVTSAEVGELVMKALRELDGVAYVRFASVYRSFKDTTEFMEEVKRLIETSKAHLPPEIESTEKMI